MKDRAELKELVFHEIEALHPQVGRLNDDLADHPEVSEHEFRSCQKICELLRENGMEVEEQFAGVPTGFRAVVRRDPDSDLKIGILAEYDALEGVGHACGHCASGSISVLSAIALHRCGAHLRGNIDLIGTPDEEMNGSKTAMAEQGIFDDYSFVIMIHLDNKNRTAIRLMALRSFWFNFTGKAVHACTVPWEGRNAANGAMLMMHGMDMLRQHLRDTTRIHGIITHGGEAANTVPDRVTTEFAIRHPDRDYLNEVVELVKDCARGAAMATQTEVTIEEIHVPMAGMKQNQAGILFLNEIFGELGIENYLMGEGEIFSSSDMGNVSFRCPAFHPTLSIADHPIPLHTKEFADLMKTERVKGVIKKGAEVISLMIVSVMCDPERASMMKEDFSPE